ncbi:hypothetical protein [Paenibacillus polymyxa]|uniref:hypothetical protein n=1 Tax=Paenibacillus polymyxa TaxID=1406 RepID=UPI0003D38DF6|nr:hypothetical protein [Paenibacillus polymyxa]AHC22711.1 hypothetical protein X809_06590 [Paenibacillus polymyxa CR1]
MVRAIVRLRDKEKINSLEKHGFIVYVSPILNVAGIELNKLGSLSELKNDPNVISAEIEDEGSLSIS